MKGLWWKLLAPVASRPSGGIEGGAMAKFLGLEELFEGRHVDREIIVLCVRWYLRVKFSFRDLMEMMAERGLSLAHTTIIRWVHHYAPELERRWDRFAQSAGASWRVDETYVKVRGEWVYLYRAVDRAGDTVDFCLSPRCDVAAAKACFRKAIQCCGSARGSSTSVGCLFGLDVRLLSGIQSRQPNRATTSRAHSHNF